MPEDRPQDLSPDNEPPDNESADLHDLVIRLFQDYAAGAGAALPPPETTRWYELVTAIVSSYAEPDMPARAVGRAVDTLAAANLLELETLARLAPHDDGAFDHDPILITLGTILQRCGLSRPNATEAVVAMCEAARVLHDGYDDKAQLVLRTHGMKLLDDLAEEFGFSNPEPAREFLTIWLQRSLNLPVPAYTKSTASACADFGVPYELLVRAADSANVHVGVLDDVLRAYLQDKEDSISGQNAVGADTP